MDSFADLVCPISQLNVNATSGMGIGDQAFNGTAVAQTFRTPVSEDLSITKVRVRLYRQGWPNGQLTLRIQTDNGGSPSGADVSTDAVKTLGYTSNESQQTSTFQTYGQYFDFDFANAVTLTKDTTYWLLVRTSATVNLSTFVVWAGINTNPYANGGAYYESMTTGSSIFTNAQVGSSRDLVFALCSPTPTPTSTAETEYFSAEPPVGLEEPAPEPTR